ncbi:MAG TPA: ATP-binding protein [Gaiellaceae bacterium]|jgi:signal transduction histidine kinase|nr:ATP-binding protein [Gaiellales bacterium]HYX89301.1 ATP-binding protein [Gaiellaceae bacterium]
MAVVLAGVAAFVYGHLSGDLNASVDAGLQSRAQVIVANAAHAAPSLGTSRRPLIDADEAFAQVLTASGRIVETTPAVARAPLLSSADLAGLRGPTFVDRRPPGLDPSRLLAVPLSGAEAGRVVVVGATLSNNREALDRVLVLFAVAFPVALLVSSLIGWALAGAALRPVERMRREAAAISASDPSRRLPVPETDETLARLAETLNVTFDRLQEALDRERRFVDDASHELRTPLTVLKAEVDSALTGDRSPSELRLALEGAAQEVNHLVRIAEDLLVLARAHGGRIPIRATDVPLRPLLEESRAAFAHKAECCEVQLGVHADDVVVRVDATRIRQAVDNLLENALRHTLPGGEVRVAATAAGGVLSIEVLDTGPGFDAHVLHRAFQPFMRGTNENGDGAGLGLAIVRAIAAAHGGSATAANRQGGGARVALSLPAEVMSVESPA